MTHRLLEYKGYTGSVEVSVEDNCLHGKVLFIKDLVTFEATTPAELKAQFEVAVDDYIETCRQLGIDAKKPLSGTFNVRIGSDLHQRAAEMAVRKGVPLNEFVKSAVSEKLDRAEVVHHHHHHTIEYRQVLQQVSGRDTTHEKVTVRRLQVGQTTPISH